LNKAQKKTLILVLSTGRTGTKFIKEYINQGESSPKCYHEPFFSRHFIVLSNLLYHNKISKNLYSYIYILSRYKRIKHHKHKIYIESNNFLWASVPALNLLFNIKVVHLIRHPHDYIESHLQHGFWRGIKKLLRKFIPYIAEGNNNLFMRLFMSPAEILLKRWILINNEISTYQLTNEYIQLKFEDLFQAIKIEEFERLNDFIGIKKDNNQINLLLSKKINASTNNNLLENITYLINKESSSIKNLGY